METVKVIFRECVAGLTFCYRPSTRANPLPYDLPKEVAKGYIKRGIAEYLEPDTEREPETPEPKRKKATRKKRVKSSKQNVKPDNPVE